MCKDYGFAQGGRDLNPDSVTSEPLSYGDYIKKNFFFYLFDCFGS